MDRLEESCNELLSVILLAKVAPTKEIKLTRLTHELSEATELSLKHKSYNTLLQYRKDINGILELDYNKAKDLTQALTSSPSSIELNQPDNNNNNNKNNKVDSKKELLESISNLKNQYYNLLIERSEKEILLNRVFQYDLLNNNQLNNNQNDNGYKRIVKLLEIKDQLISDSVGKFNTLLSKRKELAGIQSHRDQINKENKELLLKNKEDIKIQENDPELLLIFNRKLTQVKLYNTIIQNMLVYSQENVKDSKVLEDFFSKVDQEY